MAPDARSIVNAMLETLTTDEMARADALALEAGVSGLTLMEAAGRAVAEQAAKLAGKPGARIAVFCGPGNNGGDGFVAARHLKQMGHDVRVFLLGARANLKGAAAQMAQRWDGTVRAPDIADPASMDLIIDALFGAGLARELTGAAASVVEAINSSNTPVLAVDVPSGLDGTRGQAAGPVVRAHRTVTFFRRKIGHLLMPGRGLCGETMVADIGIPRRVLDEIRPRTWVNAPPLWLDHFPIPRLDGHKYDRGHVVVVSGPPECTGAARLGARGALRAGAGLVTVVGSGAATAVNCAHLTAIMVRALSADQALGEFLADRRRNCVLIGPGAGVGAPTAKNVLTVLASPAAVVLDADALTSFTADGENGGAIVGIGFTAKPPEHVIGAQDLWAALKERSAPVVMTPHEGEFQRLFALTDQSKCDRARKGARMSGAIVVLKGADTVIASPDGRAAINENAPPWLASAGSGDVLAGFISGLLAQAMPAWEAACAAVWLHGACANIFGPGLIAEDLPEVLPQVLVGLKETWNGL